MDHPPSGAFLLLASGDFNLFCLRGNTGCENRTGKRVPAFTAGGKISCTADHV